MPRLTTSLAVTVTAFLAQGCATPNPTQQPTHAASNAYSAVGTADGTVAGAADGAAIRTVGTADAPGISNSCAGPQCATEVLRTAQRTEVLPEKRDAPSVPGHPLTSVVVTQCNLLVAVYLTMPDGSLLRFDSKAAVPADQLLQMAYSATRSERVEVSCHDAGAVGYEKHDPL